MREGPTTPLSRDEINRRALATDHLMSTLGRRAVTGGVIAVAGQVVQTGIALVSIIFMARLLTPADFGLVAMAATVTVFVGMFTDLGLSAATVQREDLDQDTVSALFYVNLAMGVAVMLAAFAAAPIAAWFFGDERVFWLVVALAIQIPLSAAAVQHKALLQRGMRWIAIQWTKLAAQLAGAIAAILLAWQTDLGYWSLVAQAWVIAVLGLAISWAVCRWRPGRVTSWAHARSALGFGLNLTGFNFVNYFHRQFDNVLIGWRWGSIELGYYTRAYGLLTLPLSVINGPIGSAVIPALSRLQSDPKSWRKLFLEALGMVTLISSGITALMIATADPLITILLGPGWSEAAGIFGLLAISMFGATVMNAMGWVYISLGRTRRMFAWSLMVVPVFVLSFVLGLPFGAKGVALSYSSAVCLAVLPCIAFAVQASPADVKSVIRVIFAPTLAGILASVLGVVWLMETRWSPALELITTAALTGAIYLACVAGILRFDASYVHLRHWLSRKFVSTKLQSSTNR